MLSPIQITVNHCFFLAVWFFDINKIYILINVVFTQQWGYPLITKINEYVDGLPLTLNFPRIA